jgi:threonine dehydratase
MELVRQYVDEHILVDEDDIEKGMRYLFTNHGLVAEGAASVGIGALLSGKVDVTGGHVAMPLTGRNVDMERYLSIIQK